MSKQIRKLSELNRSVSSKNESGHENWGFSSNFKQGLGRNQGQRGPARIENPKFLKIERGTQSRKDRARLQTFYFSFNFLLFSFHLLIGWRHKLEAEADEIGWLRIKYSLIRLFIYSAVLKINFDVVLFNLN